MHPLHQALSAAADGRFPVVDGLVEVCPPWPGDPHHGVFEFTGHAFVLTDHPLDDLSERGADGFGGAAHPDVLRWLAGPGGWIGSHDAVLVARGTGGGTLLERTDVEDHPRVQRARRHRRNVRVFGDETGIVTIGNGVVDRVELSVEVTDPVSSGQGRGRALIAAGLAQVAVGTAVFAQVAPGNAASLRAFLAAGFAPIGSETLVGPGGRVTGPGRS